MKIKSITPSPGNVLVAITKEEETTPGGLIMPKSNQLPQTGTVVAVGEDLMVGTDVITCPAEVGATVVYEKFGVNDFQIGKDEYRFIKFQSILATIEEGN